MANSSTHRITAIFPYLAIAGATDLRGFQLTPALSDGADGQPDHVASILRMFFDGDGNPIQRATYFEADVDLGAESAFIIEIDRLLAALAFLLFDPEHPATSLDRGYLRVWMFEPSEQGLVVTVNLRDYIDADPARQRFYCGVSDLVPHYERIHVEALSYRLLSPRYWPGADRRRIVERLLLSMFWYGRSFGAEQGYEERTSLVNLATAFEVLFDVGDAVGKQRLILDGLEELFGVEPLLASWVRQFYDTRSQVVHEGRATDLLFQHSGARRPHRNLVTSGQRLYRAAVEPYMYRHAHRPPGQGPPTEQFRQAFLLDMVPNEARLVQMAKSGSGKNKSRLLTLAGDLRFDDGTGSLPTAIRAGRHLLHAVREILDRNHVKPFRLEAEGGRSPDGLKRAYSRLGAELRRAIRVPNAGAPAEMESAWKVARSLRHFAAWMVRAVDHLDS